MARARRAMIAGNWKMNGLASDGTALALALRQRLDAAGEPGADVVVCPPATLIREIAGIARGSRLAVGAQDCHIREKGAFTGDVSAVMLADAGCRYVIVGHSERRAGHGEGDALVRAKAEAAHRAGLTAIVCVGETEAERDAGRALDVVAGQLAGSLPAGAGADDTVVAYEPVWAIGTGRTPTPEDVAAVHSHLRRALESALGPEAARRVRLLYGGSVKASNAGTLLGVADVDGALVGGASLDAAEFWSIVQAVR